MCIDARAETGRRIEGRGDSCMWQERASNMFGRLSGLNGSNFELDPALEVPILCCKLFFAKFFGEGLLVTR